MQDPRLTFDGENERYPSIEDLLVVDRADVAVYAHRESSSNPRWRITEYTVLGDGFTMVVDSPERADVACCLLEVFGPEGLLTAESYSKHAPVKLGVPSDVALDGEAAVTAWLFATGASRDELADRLDADVETVESHLSEIRHRDGAQGIPSETLDELPDVRDVVPAIPMKYYIEDDSMNAIEFDCGHQIVTTDVQYDPDGCPTCGGEA